ncbi:MAG: PAS domain S-box protein [Fuerstiella sp.]
MNPPRLQNRLAVLNSLQNGLPVVSSEFRIELVSPSARELTGWNQQDAVGQKVETVFRIEGVDDLPQFLAQLSEPLSVQDAVLLCNDGRQRNFRWNATPIQYEQSSESEFVIVFYEITQEKYLTQRTENFDRIQSLGILAGGIAHDFNNNLAAIQASIDCVTSVDAPTELQSLNITRRACMEARQLTQQLLAFSKGGVPVRKPHRIEDILRLPRRCRRPAGDLVSTGRSV